MRLSRKDVEDRKGPEHAVCVLGMHRSGTSCLTGSLEEAGVFLGEVCRQNRFNPKGNRENGRLMSLQNALLKANGGSWRNPPHRIHWNNEHQQERDAILALLHGCPCWGFKDPRTLFTLDGWMAALPRLKMIGIVRHPLSVAKSLQRRDGWPLGAGMDLWARYNARLLQYAATYRFPVISFDQPAKQFVDKLGELVKNLGLDPPSKGFQFFHSSLRHHHDADLNAVPDPIACLYLSIQQLTI